MDVCLRLWNCHISERGTQKKYPSNTSDCPYSTSTAGSWFPDFKRTMVQPILRIGCHLSLLKTAIFISLQYKGNSKSFLSSMFLVSIPTQKSRYTCLIIFDRIKTNSELVDQNEQPFRFLGVSAIVPAVLQKQTLTLIKNEHFQPS